MPATKTMKKNSKATAKRTQHKVRPVVVTIGANTELVLTSKVNLDKKHVVLAGDRRISVGGSSLNHTCRLLAMGQPVMPILPITDDAGGNKIMAAIEDAAKKGGIAPPKVTWVAGAAATPHTIILADPDTGQRTLFNTPTDAIDRFDEHLDDCLDKIDDQHVGAVMIGHVHADADRKCFLTRRAIGRFQGKYTFVNPGASQYRHGADALDNLVGIDCLQLQIGEARSFAKNSPSFSGSPESLKDMLDWLAKHAELAIITLGKVGAVAKKKAGKGSIAIAWPYRLGKLLKDSTGAGDAFGAGTVWWMLNAAQSGTNLRQCLTTARRWAGCACQELGGATNCPGKADLADFDKRCKAGNLAIRDVEELSAGDAEFFMQLLELAGG